MGNYALSDLPSVSGAEAVKALERDGWVITRSKGSHVIMTKEGQAANLSVPQHKELKRPTLKNILQAAELTAKEFKELL